MSQYLPHSYNNNIVMIKPFLFFFIILLFSFSLKTLVVVADNPLVELSSREELINVAGYGETKLSTVLVIGTLVCEEASSSLDIGKPQLNSYPLSGATVGISCHPCRKMREVYWVKSTTDEDGDFVIDLPSDLHGIPNLENKCTLKVVHLQKTSNTTSPNCHYLSNNNKYTALKLLSVRDGTRTYTTETIRLMSFK